MESVLQTVQWREAEIASIVIDYDRVVLTLRESTGGLKSIQCHGHIGFAIFGFWDEIIVERAEIAEKHDAIDRCTTAISKRLGPRWLDSGNEDRNSRRWKVLLLHFLDGSVLEIVASRFAVDTVSEVARSSS